MRKERERLNRFTWLYFVILFYMVTDYTYAQSKKNNLNRTGSKSDIQNAMFEWEVNNDTFYKSKNILALLAVTGLIFNTYRLKQRNDKMLYNKQLEISQQKEILEKLLGEKEWLLKEIHHRVKNNLQIVISLLNSQSSYLENQDAFIAIKESQYRMYAMSLIHQKLYESDTLSYLDMSWYIYELVKKMKECLDTKTKINFILDTEKVYLDVVQAVPLGLIINEVLNNAIKHAYPLEEKGNVYISLKNIEKNNYQLIISDNGIGLPEDFEIEQEKSFGMNLIVGLSNQIDAIFEMDNTNGLKITVTFTRNTEFKISLDNSENI
ncbi:sensor histidine kinase [Flavobacterium sp. 5]|uniref:sensor histidine kinase n=1 Tax=Flavobacterium sp. 5 TaxID=2035199 RepID=UPI000C2BA2E0|nr:sensor histidine kinase [Flavobacterium sp. 5]PKB18810.1 two-component sensor histidine kinase [Flavobacterium sp. 5]